MWNPFYVEDAYNLRALIAKCINSVWEDICEIITELIVKHERGPNDQM